MKSCPGGPDICLDRKTAAWYHTPTIILALVCLFVEFMLIKYIAQSFFGPEWGLRVFTPIICGIVAYFQVNSYIRQNKGNTAVILVDNLAPIHSKWAIGIDAVSNTYQVFSTGLTKQRITYEGLQITTPFQTVYKELDLRREIPITFGEKDTFYDKNNVRCNVQGLVVLRIIPELALNFAMNEEAVVIQEFRARAEGAINQYLSQNSVQETLQDFQKFQVFFEKTFGGPGVLDELETRYGVWTGTPILFDLNLGEDFAKANEARATLKLLTETALDIVQKSNNSLTFEQAYRIVQIQQGHLKAEFSDYNINIEGLPQDLKQFIVGTLPNLGGSKKQSGKGKGGTP